MLKIKNISATSDAEEILKNINLEIKPGEIHAVMGPKHSGKSALAHSITGHPSINISEGDILWNRKKINNYETEKRSELGIFISFQFPPEFETITNFNLTKEFFKIKDHEIEDLKIKYESCCELLGFFEDHGDKCPSGISMNMSQAKKNELIYMILSNPKMIILDEIDDGVSDEDVVLIGSILKQFLDKNRSCLAITNSGRLLQILEPTHVHVMVNGEIKLSGDDKLYKRIVEDGYSEFS